MQSGFIFQEARVVFSFFFFFSLFLPVDEVQDALTLGL